MFRSKRHSLVKRLWKFRILQNETGSSTETADELELKSVAHSMLKRLKEKQLEGLLQSLETRGGEATECVLLPRGDQRLGRRSVSPLMICCKLWRWGDITNSTELKRLHFCTAHSDPVYECCNPYHWSLLMKPDIQVPNLSRAELEKTKYTDNVDRPPDEAVSMETGMTPTCRRDSFTDTSQGGRRRHWCMVAYWELRERVGRLLTVFEPSVNIFQQLPHGDGLWLEILQEDNDNIEPPVRRTREKIGYGLILSKEDTGVWVYNRSLYPVFVNSPTLEVPNCRTLFVHKLPPGYSIKIFDYDTAHVIEEIRDPKFLDGPYHPFSIQISFAKGWGPHYSRRFVFSCPCWLEILLTGDR